MRLRLTLATVVAALLLPASAGAVTFGANLAQRTANSTATCGYPPYYPGFVPLGSSCTFFSTATPAGQAGETQVVPLPDPAIHGNQKGTINLVRIKTGNYQAGPAKLTVLRSHRAFNGGEATCCIGQAESAQFTLTPNSIVNVTTNLPVESKYDAGQRIYTYDTLALTVLDATTPIPAEFSGGAGGYCSSGYFPYIQTGEQRFTGSYGVCGYLVLMSADMTVNSATGGGAAIDFPAKRGRIAGRNAKVKLKCAGNATCEGVLRLQSAASAKPSAAKAKKRITYAKGRFKIAAGATVTVKAKLTKQGRKAAKRRSSFPAYANVTLKDGKTATKKLILKAR